MNRWLFTILLSLTPVLAFAAGDDLACEMRALTKSERVRHGTLLRQLLAIVREKRELSDGYALRLAPEFWLSAAQWVALERKCCPFFAFELRSASGEGPLWLLVTGPAGAKAFMREELGL